MKNLTDITIILDRSGSMQGIKEATITAFNTFLKEQKKDGLPTNLSFIQFDDQYEKNYTEKDIHLAKELNAQTFEPRGLTALLDAVGRTVKNTKKRIRNKDKSERPDKVIIAIITDGFENASREYTRKKIFKMIRKHEEKDNWKFVFLAANQDAIAEGARFGIHQDRAMTYRADKQGIHEAFVSFNNKLSNYKQSALVDLKFDEEDRKKQEKGS
jgi:uncharacterized protein YegL